MTPADVILELEAPKLTNLRVIAEALASMRGGEVHTLREASQEDCHRFLQELSLLGRLEQVGLELLWSGQSESIVVLDNGKATPALRQATLEGRSIRRGRQCVQLQTSDHDMVYDLNRCYGVKRYANRLTCIDLTGQSDCEELRLRVLQRGPQPTAYPAIVQARKALTGFEERAWQVGSQSDPDPLERELLFLVEDFPHTVARLEPHRVVTHAVRAARGLVSYLKTELPRAPLVTGVELVLRRSLELLAVTRANEDKPAMDG